MLLNLCPGPAAFNFAEIPVIFHKHISWVVAESSAKFGPNCSRFRKMAAILHRKITFLHFSPNLIWLFQRNLVGKLLGVKGTLSVNLTSTLGNGGHFKG